MRNCQIKSVLVHINHQFVVVVVEKYFLFLFLSYDSFAYLGRNAGIDSKQKALLAINFNMYTSLQVTRGLAFSIIMFVVEIFPCHAAAADYVEKSFNDGVENLQSLIPIAIDNKKPFQGGTLWNMQKINTITNSQIFASAIQKMSALTDDPAMRLVNPNVKKVSLPGERVKGMLKFSYYVLAPVGEPEHRAISFIDTFTSRIDSGYTLTHQLLVLEWAKEQNIKLPTPVIQRRNRLLESIRREQNSATQFDDLYAERAGILLLYNHFEEAEVDRWIKKIVASQHADGGWGEYGKSITFEGRTYHSKPGDPSHTSSWALLALAVYIHNTK